MLIDHSRWSAFYTSPELYRIQYERNLAPRVVPYHYGRGIYMHELAEARNKGAVFTNSAVKGIQVKSKQVGRALFDAYKRKYDGDTRFQLMYDAGKPLAEIEFTLPIPGSPHIAIGRIDEIISYKEELWVGDIKTANIKATEAKKTIEFRNSMQPNFYIPAARAMGYDVKGMLYRVVTEHTPPQHYIIPTVRSEADLAASFRAIHQTCEMILMLKRTFGTEVPWPHHFNNYPCNYQTWDGKPACDFHSICNRDSREWTEDDLKDFTPRVEHLDQLK